MKVQIFVKNAAHHWAKENAKIAMKAYLLMQNSARAVEIKMEDNLIEQTTFTIYSVSYINCIKATK